MSIKYLITRGIGNGTFSGDPNQIVTRGYSNGEPITEHRTLTTKMVKKIQFRATKKLNAKRCV